MKNEFEREGENYQRAEIAKEQIGKLISLNNISPEDVVNTEASLTIVKAPETPDLRMDPKKINITISELEERVGKNNLDPELGRKMIESLEIQRSISLNRVPSFAEKVRTAPSRVIESVSGRGFLKGKLTGAGKVLIGINGVAVTSGIFSTINHFDAGDANGGFFFLGLAGLNSLLGVFNFITHRE